METRIYRGISYRTGGRGEAIVLIHGLSGSSSAWQECERHFSRTHRVISIDLRGHGKSWRPTRYDDFSIRGFSEDIHMVLQRERIRACVLVAHSFGTLIALDFLTRHQGMARKAVLVSATYAPAQQAGWLRPLLRAARAINILPTLRKRGGHVQYSKYIGTGDWNLRRSYADITNTGVKSYVNALCHAYEHDATAALPEITIPILLVHGEQDTIFPITIARRMAKMLPHAKLVVLQADHIIVLNHSAALISAIDEFLR